MGIKSVFHAASGGLFSLLLFLQLILTNIAQTLSLVLFPFSRRAFRSFNRLCAGSWWGSCVVIAQWLHGSRLIYTGDTLPDRENAIVISNHQQMTDIFVLMMLAKPRGRLGDLKWFVKDVIKYVPGVGWGMLFLDCLYVKRDWDADKDRISTTFSKFQKNQIPIWLISFVEGTRIKPEKLKRSQKFAREKGLPVLENVLLPRTKGFAASVQGLSGHAKAVYDVTIGYPAGPPNLWQMASGKATEFHIHVRRFSLTELPSNPVELASWLVTRYQEKDQLLKQFQLKGAFASVNGRSQALVP